MTPLLLLWLFPTAPADVDVSLRDLAVFPPHEVCASNLRLAQEHCRWVQKQYELSPNDSPLEAFYVTWRIKANYNAECWRRLTDATDHFFDKAYRLECLRELRIALGREDYYAGKMVPIVPLCYVSRLP